MRICVLAPNFNRGSGVTTVIRNLYLAMGNNPQFELFCVDARGWPKDDHQDSLWIRPDRYVQFPLLSGNRMESVYAMYRFKQWVKECKIDVIHLHHRRLMPIARLVAAVCGAKTLYTAHDIFPEQRIFRMFSGGMAASISRAVGRNIQETSRCTPIFPTGNPFPFSDRFTQEMEGDYTRRAVCIARFDPVKGHAVLIEAWKLLKESGMKRELLLLGAGEALEEELKQQVRTAGLEGEIKFSGMVADVRKELRQCLFSILTSKHEGLPMVVLEAADSGRATLMTRVPGLEDCLPSSSLLPNGLEYGDARALASALRTWFSDPAATLQAAEPLYNELKEKFDSKIVAQRYVEIFDQIMVSAHDSPHA